MKPKLVFSAPHAFLPEPLMEALGRRFEVDACYRMPLEEQLKRLREARVWVVSTAPERFLGREVFERCPALEVVATPSTGTTHLDTNYLAECGIRVLTIRGSPIIDQIRASSEFTLALLLALVRKLPAALKEVEAGRWRDAEAELRGNELHGRTLGVVGHGRIGRNMCHYANALGMHTLAYDPYQEQVAPYTRLVGLDELLAASDVVCLCAHLTAETRDFFGKPEFQKMKRGSWFINTARGELVDEGGLVGALESGHLAGAAVDVLRDEQSATAGTNVLRQHALRHTNLIISPHVAGLTVESEVKAAGEIVRQLVEIFPEH